MRPYAPPASFLGLPDAAFASFFAFLAALASFSSFLSFRLAPFTPPAALKASMDFSYSAFASAACFSKLAFSFAPSPFHRADSSFVTGPKSFTPSSFCTASLFAWRYRKYAVIAFLGSSVAAMTSGWKRRGQRTQWILGGCRCLEPELLGLLG